MKKRIDHLIVEKFNLTRSKAIDYIKRGYVYHHNEKVSKPSLLIDVDSLILLKPSFLYVSKGGYKLKKIIDETGYNFTNKVVVDIGASTGGFTDFCLQNGAIKVYSVDVGSDLLDPKLKKDPRVVIYDNTNVKNLRREMFNENIDVIVADLSFISLSGVFKNISSIANQNTTMYLLIKPQFELGKEIASTYKGIIRNEARRKEAINLVYQVINQNGYLISKIVETSVFDEKKQNIEYMIEVKYANQK
ncbi:TlyA family RNA methyltransferase [Ureaplasma canigenitalium]|uniref:TlyA family RNA methyltransferase n=1 Tax=Ureaplasma canigenitalium TaxID=42092 RepID=UPI0004E1353A|nr:TlyA family RNA methyltransferase [Ureaplasma canigenitalium]